MTAPTTFIFMALLFVEARRAYLSLCMCSRLTYYAAVYVIAMILSLNLRAFLRDNSAARAAAGTTIELDTDVNHSHVRHYPFLPTPLPDCCSG